MKSKHKYLEIATKNIWSGNWPKNESEKIFENMKTLYGCKPNFLFRYFSIASAVKSIGLSQKKEEAKKLCDKNNVNVYCLQSVYMCLVVLNHLIETHCLNFCSLLSTETTFTRICYFHLFAFHIYMCIDQ